MGALKLSSYPEHELSFSRRENVSHSEIEFPQKLEVIGRRSRENISDVLSKTQEGEKKESGKIIELPKANLKVGSISNKKYERRHGLRKESFGKRILNKYITNPIGTASLAVGDFVFKSYIRGKKDMFDFLRLKWSDKHNNYQSGAIPLPIRATIGIGGSLNAVSTLLGNTRLGRASIKYRKARRGRVDRLKQWIMTPFHKLASKTSSQLPLYEERYKFTQGARKKRDKFAQQEAKLDSWINGGIKGWIARKRQKKYLRQRQEQKKGVSDSLNRLHKEGSSSEMSVISRNKRPIQEPITPEVLPSENPSEESVPIAA